MQVKYTTPNGRLTFEQEVTTGKQAFEFVAAVQALFEEASCGCCKSESIRCNTRDHDGNRYYELTCNSCGAKMDFGQNKDGKGMFAKRTDKDTYQPLPNRGWYIYQRKGY